MVADQPNAQTGSDQVGDRVRLQLDWVPATQAGRVTFGVRIEPFSMSIQKPDEFSPMFALEWQTLCSPNITVYDQAGTQVWPEQIPDWPVRPLEVRFKGKTAGWFHDKEPEHFFVPATKAGKEAGILWLRAPELYPVYLREAESMACGFELPIAPFRRLTW